MKGLRHKLLYLALIVLFLPLLIPVRHMLTEGKTTPEQAGLVRLALAGAYSADGGAWRSLDGGFPPGGGLRDLTVRGTFDRPVAAGETVWVRAENVGVALSVNGEQVLSEGWPGDFPALFRSPGHGWYSFRSPGIGTGDVLELRLLDYRGDGVRSAGALLESLYLGDGAGLYQLLLGQLDLFALIALVVVIAGWIYLLEGIIDKLMGVPEGGRIARSGFYFLTGGTWCLTNALYPYLSLLISPPWLVTLVGAAGIVPFPLALVLLVRSFMREERTGRRMNAVAAFAALEGLCMLALQLCGALDLARQQGAAGAATLLLLAPTIAYLVHELRRRGDGSLLLLLLAILPVLLASALDCVNALWPFLPGPTMMRYGFGLSAALMITQLITYAQKELEAEKHMRHMKEELLESRIAIMLSQIHPHFLYNALEAIGGLCRIDAARAEQAITDFSLFLRGNLDSLSSTEPIPFEKELSHTNYYLELEQLRFGSRLRVEFHTEALDFRLPCLTLQPIAENAVRHSVTKRREGGKLTISTRETGRAWLVTVEDDGADFDPPVPQKGGRSHVGLSNVRERLRAQCGGSLTVETAPGEGTRVVITIPKEESGHEDHGD